MGHSSIQMTYDRYGHLLDGDQEEAGNQYDEWLEEKTNNLKVVAVR